MAKIFGTAFSSSDALHRPSGIVVNAAVRRYRNTVSLATEGGGTTDALIGATLRAGNALCEVRMSSDVNLSGINFTVGTEAEPAKYGAAQAGPNATTKTFVVPAAALADAGVQEGADEEVIFTPSGALPAAGLIVVEIFASKR